MTSSFQVILPSSGGDEINKNSNRPGNFTISFAPNINLGEGEEEYEVGLSEIVYPTVTKESDQKITLPFTFYQFATKAGNESDPLYQDLSSPTPFMWGPSPEFKINGFHYKPTEVLAIELTTGSLDNINTILYAKYPWAEKCISFTPGTQQMLLTIIPQREIDRVFFYHVMIPNLGVSSHWNVLFEEIRERLDFRNWALFLDHVNLDFSYEEAENIAYAKFWASGNGRQFTFQRLKKEGWFNLEDTKKINPLHTGKEKKIIKELKKLPHSLTNEGAIILDDYKVKTLVTGLSKYKGQDFVYNENEFIQTPINPLSVPISGSPPQVEEWSPGDKRIDNEAPPAFYFYLEKRFFDVRDAADSFFILSDIIDPSLVGDQICRVLRIIPYNTQNTKEMYSIQFDPVFYKRVNKRLINSIKIMIVNTLGQEVQFPSGKEVIVHLEFRKRNGNV